MTAIHAVSRRAFGKLVGTGVAAAALRPLFAAPARPRLVRLSANENPYGPSPAALEAMRAACGRAFRYPDEAVGELRAEVARLHDLPTDWVLIGDGSSEILKLAASAFTGPGRKLVMGEPAFEAIASHARIRGAEVTAVPLDRAFAHDLAKMSPEGAGLIY